MGTWGTGVVGLRGGRGLGGSWSLGVVGSRADGSLGGGVWVVESGAGGI